MAMRLTGMQSGLDTESIIQELVAARQVKVDTTVKAQTKLSWKQEAWKSLNTKLKGLQSKYLNNMRFTSSYSKKATSVSNSSVVSVITGENAVDGVQSLKVSKLAKTGYLTGAEIEGKDGSDLTALSKLGDITSLSGGGTISIKAGGKAVDINVNENTTISDVLTKMKDAGVNASFDAKQQRFFVSSKKSGEANDFSITALDANGATALSALGLQVNLNSDTATLAEYEKYAAYDTGDKATTLANVDLRKEVDADIAARTNAYVAQYKEKQASLKAAQDRIAEINAKYTDTTLEEESVYTEQLDAKNQEIADLQGKMTTLSGAELDDARAQLKTLQEEAEAIRTKRADAVELASKTTSVTKLNEEIAEIESYVDIAETTADDGTVTYSGTAKTKLTDEVENRFYNKVSYAAQVMSTYDPNNTTSTGATKVKGQDAVIVLNDATFTSNDNVFEINGLTFTALSETKGDEVVTITTQNDTDGIYDMVKDFLKEYNSIINEMDKLYNADSAKGYEPLTSDEKESMSESEIEKWEKTIKDSLLRRDSNLSTVSSALKSVMSSGFEVNGKKMYLSDFGIATLGYFEAPDNEKNAYHIDGDPDDASTSANADKLKSMISSDPDTVISFFSQMSKSLYAKMDSLSKSVEGYRSYGSFYDDKKMASDYTDYKTKIADLEEKLADYEDRWYAKFSAMETALARMQSNMTAVTGMLGG